MFKEFIADPLLQSFEQYKNNNAFCIAETMYTYQDLAKSISKIRKALQSTNVTSKNIGLVTNDDIETYASIFAIWFEGYAYVPLHSHQPKDRSLEIVSQAQVELILDSSSESIFKPLLVISTSNLNFESYILEPKTVSEDSLAYILFTSGSTGKPKGVMISRKNIGAFMNSFWKTGIQINETDRCLQCFDLTFDVSVQSYLVPLIRGACTYTIPHHEIKYSYVYGLFEKHQLTFGAMAPSMIRFLRPYFDEINVPSMRYNIVTAEASPVDLIAEWSKCIPNAEIYDFYGPTEATIYCTYQKFVRNEFNKQLNGMLSIGKAMPGLTAIIIDEDLKLLGANQKGELCISGDQLTPGYWNNPEKNKISFIEIETDGKLARFYKTGDSCYFDEDGDILLAGRLDFQVKIQGYRIELGEIEYHAREFLKGQNAIAIAIENKTGNTEIALVIESNDFNTEKINQFLKSKLPPYMIPTSIRFIPQFPLNNSSKIDRIKIKTLI